MRRFLLVTVLALATAALAVPAAWAGSPHFINNAFTITRDDNALTVSGKEAGLVQPDCSPPMTVVFTDVTVTDTTNGLTHSFPGTL